MSSHTAVVVDGVVDDDDNVDGKVVTTVVCIADVIGFELVPLGGHLYVAEFIDGDSIFMGVYPLQRCPSQHSAPICW